MYSMSAGNPGFRAPRAHAALHREHRILGVLVGDGDPVGRDGLQRGDDRRGVGGVGNQEHLVRADG